MERDIVFLYIIAGVSFVFALFNGIFMAVKRGTTVKTEGRIVSIKSTSPANERWRNAKLAKVSYLADGRSIVSKNRIQVPLASGIGTRLTVRYDRNQPERIYSYSVKRMVAGFLLGAGSVMIAVLMQIY